MKNIVILLLAFTFTCCSEKITDTCSIGKFKFELIEKNGNATLRTILNDNVSTEYLQLNPPCYFLRRNDTIQTYAYSDINVEKVLIVIGDIAKNESKKKYGVESDELCGEKIQGLVLKNSTANLSSKIITGSLTCINSGIDEKDFWSFAHD